MQTEEIQEPRTVNITPHSSQRKGSNYMMGPAELGKEALDRSNMERFSIRQFLRKEI